MGNREVRGDSERNAVSQNRWSVSGITPTPTILFRGSNATSERTVDSKAQNCMERLRLPLDSSACERAGSTSCDASSILAAACVPAADEDDYALKT